MTRIPNGLPHTVRPWRLGDHPWQLVPPMAPARVRVIVDNDFSGDPDDLFHLVHQVLSPSTELRAVIASHLRDGDGFDPGPHTAGNATLVARDLLARLGAAPSEIVHRGSDGPLADESTPRPSDAVDAIIAEALRDDDRPLFYLAGGGLTDLASALLTDPRIAERMTLIWIGGGEHPGLAIAPPDAMPIEYNLLIDITAARVVFDSGLSIWQVPRDVYRQCLVSDAELRGRVASRGSLGRYLYDEVAEVARQVGAHGGNLGETYALGDSPLTLLSALQSAFEPDPASSRYVTRPTPGLDESGQYIERPAGRSMRVYTWVDTRLMFEDFFLKLGEFTDWQNA